MPMKILNAHQCQQKLKRLAIEILEHNFNAQHLALVGINTNGAALAHRLYEHLGNQLNFKACNLHLLSLSVTAFVADNVALPPSFDEQAIEKTTFILVDDVANTGRTLFAALMPFAKIPCRRLEIAVLVDRQHKSFPLKPNYIGLSLATTIQDHIEVVITNTGDIEAFLGVSEMKI